MRSRARRQLMAAALLAACRSTVARSREPSAAHTDAASPALAPALASDGRPVSAGAPALAGGADATSLAPTTFALIGDTPYNPLEERLLARVLDDIDGEVEFVIHVGDLKSGWEPCSDALLSARHDALAASRHPLVYLPGDNEWLDCARKSAGGFDPMDRLELLRDLFYRRPGPPTAPPGLQRQRDTAFDFPENQRWRAGSAIFTTLNLPGSNNGADDDPSLQPRHASRAAANEAWLRACFAIADAEHLPAVVIAIHADPGFEHDHRSSWLPGAARSRDGYHDFRQLLRELVTSSAAQVLLLHGDSHQFRADQPMHDARGRQVRNFHRVECFGSPFASAWVRVSIDPRRDPPFIIATRRVETSAR